IGLVIARSLVGQDVRVAVTGRDERRLAAARGAIEGAGPGAVETLCADVRRYPDVERVVSATVTRFGRLDILVNNAGVGVFDDVHVSYVLPGSVATACSGGDETKGNDWKIAPEEVADVVMNLLRHDPRSLPSRVELRPLKPRK